MLKIKRAIKIVSVNFFVLLALLVILEIVLRLLGYGYNNSPADPDPVLHHVHPANYLYKLYTPGEEFGNFMVYYDSLGRRSQLPGLAGKGSTKINKTVAFFGDSFVEALQVPYDSSFIGLLSKKFSDARFLNYGVTGYSPVLSYLQCRKMLEQHKVLPDIVVMMLYSNDVRDDSTYIRRAVYSEDNHELSGIKGGDRHELFTFFRKLYLARMIRKAMVKWEFQRKHKDYRLVNGVMVRGLLEESPDISNTLTEEYVLKTDSLLKSYGISFYIAVIPSRYRNFTSDTGFVPFSAKIRSWAASRNISLISMDSAFDAAGRKLFYNIDVHCNAEGHKVLASVFETVISDRIK